VSSQDSRKRPSSFSSAPASSSASSPSGGGRSSPIPPLGPSASPPSSPPTKRSRTLGSSPPSSPVLQGVRPPSPQHLSSASSSFSPMLPVGRSTSPLLAPMSPFTRPPSPQPASRSTSSSSLSSLLPSPPLSLPPLSLPPVSASSSSSSLAPVPETIQRINAGGQFFYAHQPSKTPGNAFFHPLNPDTSAFSSYPHISLQAGKLHATDISKGRIDSLHPGSGNAFTDSRTKKKKKPVPLGQSDGLGRELHARDNTAQKSLEGKGYAMTDPLSPRTLRHKNSAAPHRLAGKIPGPVETVPLTDQLRAAHALTPFTALTPPSTTLGTPGHSTSSSSLSSTPPPTGGTHK